MSLGLDAQKLLNCIQTAENRMLIKIWERGIQQPLNWAPRTWNFVQYNRSLSLSVLKCERNIVDVILHLLAV